MPLITSLLGRPTAIPTDPDSAVFRVEQGVMRRPRVLLQRDYCQARRGRREEGGGSRGGGQRDCFSATEWVRCARVLPNEGQAGRERKGGSSRKATKYPSLF